MRIEVETAHGFSWPSDMFRCCLANMTVNRQLCGNLFKEKAPPGGLKDEGSKILMLPCYRPAGGGRATAALDDAGARLAAVHDPARN
jgi:hypothetical protein